MHGEDEEEEGNARSVNDLGMKELQSLLRESDQNALFRSALKCPVDQEHVIDIGRLKSHIADCRRRNAHLGQVRCPFNEYHYTDATGSHDHASSCPDRTDGMMHIRCPEPDKSNASFQILELKIQCGLPLTAEEEALYGKYTPDRKHRQPP